MTYLEAERDAILKAYHAYNKALSKLQATCEHKTILLAGSQYMEYFRDLPAIRICEDCGLEEDARYGAWKKLTGRAYTVDRNEVYRNRPKQTYISEEDRKRLGIDGDLSQDSDSL